MFCNVKIIYFCWYVDDSLDLKLIYMENVDVLKKECCRILV